MKKKRGRPVKKRSVEPVVETPSEVNSIEEKYGDILPACECGEPVHPGSHQCWNCSHRS